MKLVISSSPNPYTNLATEEYLLKNCLDDFLLLYINQPCVVVGKHQIAQKEINSGYLFDNKILVARRLSGGGAVYHDEGNLNFSFIRTILSGENISYKTITKPIIAFLLHSGIKIEMSERNDILYDGKKISGSAMHIYKNRALAHGTLLINSSLNNLSYSLKGNPERYKDKSIASTRSKVMNLSELDKQMTAQVTLSSLKYFLLNVNSLVEDNSILPTGKETINELASTKYSTEDWIYGYSPKYTYQSKLSTRDQTISFKLDVEKGIIIAVKFDSESGDNSSIKLMLNQLIGSKHNIHSLKRLFPQELDASLTSDILTSLF